MLPTDVEAVDVVEGPIEDLADDREEPPVLVDTIEAERRGDERVVDDADAVRVRQPDRPLSWPASCTHARPVISPLPLRTCEPAK
jgi:hypothetical protein